MSDMEQDDELDTLLARSFRTAALTAPLMRRALSRRRALRLP